MRRMRLALALAIALTFLPSFSARADDGSPFPEKAYTLLMYSVRTPVNGVKHQMQGACTDGRYIWAGWNNRRTITRLDTTTWEMQTREFSPEDWVCGHINDMAYNPNTNIVYVVGYDPDDYSTRGNIAMFDPITLEYKGMIHLSHKGEMIPINSMVYDRLGDRYIVSLAGRSGQDNVILDSNFKYVGPLTLERAETITLQGFDTDGVYLYRSIWSKNASSYITVYDMSGRFIAQIDTGIPGNKMELEDIMYDWNGAWYLNYSHRDGTGGSFYYTQLKPEEDHSLLENILGRIAAAVSYTL